MKYKYTAVFLDEFDNEVGFEMTGSYNSLGRVCERMAKALNLTFICLREVETE